MQSLGFGKYVPEGPPLFASPLFALPSSPFLSSLFGKQKKRTNLSSLIVLTISLT